MANTLLLPEYMLRVVTPHCQAHDPAEVLTLYCGACHA